MAGLLRKFVKAWSDTPLEPISILIGNLPVIVSFRRNSRAKRIILRLTRDATGVAVTVPKNVSAARARAFVEKSVPWISKHLKQRTPRTVLGPGSIVPLRGIPHEVHATTARRGLITIDPAARRILVPGDPRHLSRRLQDWLKAQAKADLAAASPALCKIHGRRFQADFSPRPEKPLGFVFRLRRSLLQLAPDPGAQPYPGLCRRP